MALKTYDYIGILEQLYNIEPEERHKNAINTIIHGLENYERFHWINDALEMSGDQNIETILDYYKINYQPS
jgi:hypothetical protein